MKKGFTLIELLVVVLIIGILASVAVVEYSKAIRKARALKGIPYAKAVQTSLNEYYMANGNYTNVWDGLTIPLPNGATDGTGNPISTLPTASSGAAAWISYDYGTADQRCYRNQGAGKLQLSTLYKKGENCSSNNGADLILYFYADFSSKDDGKYQGKIRCTSTTATGREMCQTIGGTPDPNNNNCKNPNKLNGCNSYLLN